jgi:hypothetical protein
MTYQNVSIIKTSNITTQHQKFQTSKVAAEGSKTTSKNMKLVVQHHTLHGDPCTTNILNFLLFFCVTTLYDATDLTCFADDDGGIDTVL